MTHLIVLTDCGNSPKNLFVQELTIVLATGNVNETLARVSDDIQWEIIGKRRLEGKFELAGRLDELRNDPPAELAIHHVLSHGKAGAVDGAATFSDGKKYRFCNFYEFAGAKGTIVRRIVSYLLPV